MQTQRRSPEEELRLALEWYDRVIKALAEPNHLGELLAVDVDTGYYELGNDLNEVFDHMKRRDPAALPFVLRAVDDTQIKAFLGRALGAQLRNAPLTALAGHFVRLVTAAGYHEAVLDRALNYARDFLGRNEERLLDTVAERRRSWIPRAINREIARAMLRGAEELIDDLRKPDGSARQSLLSAIDDMAAELMNAPADPAGERARLPNLPELQAWLVASWDKGRDIVLADLASPSSRLRRTLALAIASIGETLGNDAAMQLYASTGGRREAEDDVVFVYDYRGSGLAMGEGNRLHSEE